MMKTTETVQAKQIEALIEKYFDGATSLKEETTLRLILANTALSTPAIEEAKAVLGIFAAIRKQQPAVRKRSARKKNSIKWAVAASVTLVICASVATMMSPRHDGQYLTRMNGTETDNPEAAISLMNSQIAEMSRSCDIAQEAMLTEFTIISESIQ